MNFKCCVIAMEKYKITDSAFISLTEHNMLKVELLY